MTPTEFKARFPEFDSVDDSRIQVFIDDAELELDEGVWGTWYEKGLAYLTAHFLTIANQTAAGASGSTGGPVASRSVGDVSISFARGASTGATEDYFNSTSYGQEYFRMVNIVGVRALAVTG